MRKRLGITMLRKLDGIGEPWDPSNVLHRRVPGVKKKQSSYNLRRLLRGGLPRPEPEESNFESEGPMGNLSKPRQRILSERNSSACKPNGYAFDGDGVVERARRGKRVKGGRGRRSTWSRRRSRRVEAEGTRGRARGKQADLRRGPCVAGLPIVAAPGSPSPVAMLAQAVLALPVLRYSHCG